METVVRVAVIYLVIIAGLRVLGKREFGQLSPLELVTLLLIPEIVAQALVGEDFSMTNAIVGIATLFALVFLTSVVMHMSHRAESLITGVPTVLAHDGQFVAGNMNRERITPDEVYAELHKAGLEKLAQAKWIILEADGKLAIISRDDQEQPSRPHAEDKVVG
jgi:uncharacterized membrane protein YcaP (DUF421 family)